MKKKLLALLIVLATLISIVSISAFAAFPNSIDNAQDAMWFCRQGSSSSPVTIKAGTLYKNGKASGTVYVVGLTGTDGAATGTIGAGSCVGAALSIPTEYVTYARNYILDRVPKGANIVLIGHSLGGMTAQQLAADSKLKKNYNILNTLAIGAPYVAVVGREGSLKRLADRADAVPGLSLAGFANLFAGSVSYESSGLGNVHMHSYLYGSCWLKYDAYGTKNGTTRIVF